MQTPEEFARDHLYNVTFDRLSDDTRARDAEIKRECAEELARLRAERDELLAAAKVVLSEFPENRDGMDYSGPLPVGIKRLRLALSRTEGGEVGG